METYFKESRFSLSTTGEFLVRLISYVWYVCLVTSALLFASSDSSSLKWVAFLIGIFLIDRIIHLGEGEITIQELRGNTINVARVMTPGTYRVVNYAYRKAVIAQQCFTLLLLKELCARKDIRASFRRLGVDMRTFMEKLESTLQEYDAQVKNERNEELKTVITRIMTIAYEVAVIMHERFLEPRNVFVALTKINDPHITKLFELFAINTTYIQEAVIFGRWRKMFFGISRIPATLGGFAHTSRFLRRRVMNRAWTARPTPTLDLYSTDFTNLARAEKVGFLVGHTTEFNELLNVISRPGKPNAILVGEPGSGKDAMIAHLAFRMVKDEVPGVLFDKRLVSLEIPNLFANANAEVLAGRVQKIVKEILLAGNIVLFIPNAHDLFKTGGTNVLNGVDLLLPVIKSEVIPVICESYPREFKRFIEPRSDFLEQFQVVRVEEITPEESVHFLTYMTLILERQFGIFITFPALTKAVDLAYRYFRNISLPGSALDLLKKALIRAHDKGRETLEATHVVEVAEQESKIPLEEAGEEETQKLLNLEDTIHEKLVNQDVAVKSVVRALKEYRSGLARKGGPIATFLFVGPTGVGKTELSKILATLQFGAVSAMQRFDMSEYQDKGSIQRLIGTPDGEKTGSLTDAILTRPYSLVLLDEFEKASSDIHNLFLQVFDDGRLTDSLGRTVDFQNTIIIATSNAHSTFIKESLEAGKTIESLGDEIKKKLTEYFKPELINRFSDVIVFRTLHKEEIMRVTKLLVKEIITTLRETQGITFLIDESAIQKVTALGYDPVFGARPLRKAISEQFRGVLAEKILRKEVVRGNTIRVSYEDNAFVWRIE